MGTKNQIKERNRQLFNRWAPAYDFNLFQYWMKKFQVPAIKEIDFKHRAHSIRRILDISCGTGELLNSVVHAEGSAGKSELYGIDIAEEMLKQARKKLPERIRLQKADVHQLPFQKNYFDYVMTTEAFHHYYDQPKALQEMSRVTKKGGKVIVVDVDFFLRPVHVLFQKIEPGCVRINSRQEMRTLFEEAGLRIVKQQRVFAFAVMTVGVKE